MASPYQRTPSGNKQSKNHGHVNSAFNQDQQLAVHVCPEDRRIPTVAFNEQEMDEMDEMEQMEQMEQMEVGENHRTAYHGQAMYMASPRGARGRGPEYGYGGEPQYSDLRRPARYARDGFAPGDENQYGSESGVARKNLNDKKDDGGSHVGDEHLGSTRRQRSNAAFYHGNTAMNVNAYDDDDDEMEDRDGLFVPEHKESHNIHQASKSRAHQSRRSKKSVASKLSPTLSPSEVSKRWPNANLFPPKIPTSSISDAALLKRGLKRSKNSVMSKRSHGPNDPENVLIVNLRENEKKTWPEICQILNERRIGDGKTPSFTPNGCHNRYNRNAPIIFAAEGKEFIPVSEQRKLQKNPNGPATWDDEADTYLITAVQQVDKQKWERVAALFNELTGRMITPTEAALRTKVI